MHKSIYAIGTSETVLIREVSFNGVNCVGVGSENLLQTYINRSENTQEARCSLRFAI